MWIRMCLFGVTTNFIRTNVGQIAFALVCVCPENWKRKFKCTWHQDLCCDDHFRWKKKILTWNRCTFCSVWTRIWDNKRAHTQGEHALEANQMNDIAKPILTHTPNKKVFTRTTLFLITSCSFHDHSKHFRLVCFVSFVCCLDGERRASSSASRSPVEKDQIPFWPPAGRDWLRSKKSKKGRKRRKRKTTIWWTKKWDDLLHSAACLFIRLVYWVSCLIRTRCVCVCAVGSYVCVCVYVLRSRTQSIFNCGGASQPCTRLFISPFSDGLLLLSEVVCLLGTRPTPFMKMFDPKILALKDISWQFFPTSQTANHHKYFSRLFTWPYALTLAQLMIIFRKSISLECINF